MRSFRGVSRALAVLLVLSLVLPFPVLTWRLGASLEAFAARRKPASPAPSSPPVSAPVVLPKDTTFLVEFIDGVSSRESKEGSKVHLEIREDVRVQNTIVIPYGTRFTATVSKVKKPGLFGRGGSIDLDIGSVRATNQTEVPLEIGKVAAGKNKDAGIIVPLASLILFLPGVLFGIGKGEHGKVAAGTQLYVNTKQDVAVGGLRDLKGLEGDLLADRRGPREFPGLLDLKVRGTGGDEKEREEKGSAQGIPDDVKSIMAVGMSKKSVPAATLMAKWYYKGNLVFARAVTVPRDETKFQTEMVPANGESFPAGDWRVEIEYRGELLKSASFKVVEEE